MKHIYGSVLIAWLAVELTVNSHRNIFYTASLLGALCLFIIKEKFIDNSNASIIYFIIVLILSRFNIKFILLCGIVLIDLSYFRKYAALALVFITAALFCIFNDNYSYIFHMISAVLFGYIVGTKDEKEKKHIASLDAERNMRYSLEQTQRELIKSRQEVEQLAEIRERNRIAHEIHDNIGHTIAGVIFQLEAALRILHKDIEKSETALKLCSGKLSEALKLTRNTVYNIKVDKRVGLPSIEEIISSFKFSRITFEHSGDFSTVSASSMKILESNIMEALTNAVKHSKASDIQIGIDIGRKNIRFYYKDNGIGCSNIKENIGLSGMRDRVKNAGGIISIDGSNGFLIVCNLPVCKENYGGNNIEDLDC